MTDSIAIEQDLPELASDIVAAACTDSVLMDALADYQQVCKQMNNTRARPEDRALWAEIRAELVAEIRRLYVALL